MLLVAGTGFSRSAMAAGKRSRSSAWSARTSRLGQVLGRAGRYRRDVQLVPFLEEQGIEERPVILAFPQQGAQLVNRCRRTRLREGGLQIVKYGGCACITHRAPFYSYAIASGMR